MPTDDASATPAEIVHRTAERLHSAAIHLLRRLRREDHASGLTGPRLSALSVVVFGGPIALGVLAAAEQVRAPTMTRLVAALEADGLVAREPDPRDGRSTLVRATDAGRTLLEAGRTRRTSALVRQLSSLSPEELATLREAAAILERLARER
jgi:DNA-binding MarR family transcriptional regulator